MDLPFRKKDRDPNRYWEKLRKQAADARVPFDRDMLLNLAFFLDYQWTEWAPDINAIRNIPRDEDNPREPRPVANKIMHFVAQEHAYALSNRPTVDVLPATDDPVDVGHAALSLAYLKWLSEPQVTDFDSEMSDAVFWALCAGEGFLKWTYEAQDKHPGACSVSPLDLLIDPYCKRFDHARYVIHQQFMDVEQVKARYDKDVRPEELDRADAVKSALLREMGQAPVLQGVVVNELWLRPKVDKNNPEGLFVVWTGREVLVEPRPFPYQHKKLPFTQIGSIPRPGTPHFTCAVKYMRSGQKELNKYHAQDIMVRQNFSNPKWWVPEELELQSDPDDSPNQVLRGAGSQGLKPEIIQPTSFPDARTNEWIRQELMDIVGVHEVSQAQVPGRVEAAKAIEMLKESDVSRLFVLEASIKNAIAKGFWQQLMLAKQYVSEEQILTTYSREGLPEVKRFKAEKFNPGTRVQITMGTGLARSRAARQDQALLMWEQQIIQDPEVMAELLEVPVGTIAPQRAYDVKLARNENLVMASGVDEESGAGTAIVPNSWDAHDIHIREHNNFRKTSEYAALDDEIKKKFEFHVREHEAQELIQLQKEAEKQAVVQMALTGGGQVPPPEKGSEPPPSKGEAKPEPKSERGRPKPDEVVPTAAS